MNSQSLYVQGIQSRSKWRFIRGLYPRSKKYLNQKYINWVARKNGATIGDFVTISYKLAKKANSNLTIGSHTSIQTDLIDMRAKVKIGSFVIIGSGVEIITCSHNIDSLDWEHKSYGIEIQDYAWLATRTFILPTCTKIGKGSVCAAGSVIFKNVNDMSVVSGNPAIHLRFRRNVHKDLVVESMLGNDLICYWKSYFKR